jgi:hypothetical protein
MRETLQLSPIDGSLHWHLPVAPPINSCATAASARWLGRGCRGRLSWTRSAKLHEHAEFLITRSIKIPAACSM